MFECKEGRDPASEASGKFAVGRREQVFAGETAVEVGEYVDNIVGHGIGMA